MNRMIKWDPSLAVGIEIIDNQHKVLFELAKDLNNAVRNGSNMQTIDALFNVITNYSFSHFDTEESYLINDTNYLTHCHKHYKLLKQLHEYIYDYHNGRSGEKDPGTFLDEWLIKHIKEEDLPGFGRQLESLDIGDLVDDFEDIEEYEKENRTHSRIRYDMVLDHEIDAQCYNTTKLKNSTVKVIDMSGGGLKIYSDSPHQVDDLLVISCKIGKRFSLKEKVVVKNREENLYGVEFVLPQVETIAFLTELNGAAASYY